MQCGSLSTIRLVWSATHLSLLVRVAVCCSVLQRCVAVCFIVDNTSRLICDTPLAASACCGVLQCVAGVCCSVFHCRNYVSFDLRHTSRCYCVLQCVEVYCSGVMQCAALHNLFIHMCDMTHLCVVHDSFIRVAWLKYFMCLSTLQPAATHCNTLQHTATHCNTPQHTATH